MKRFVSQQKPTISSVIKWGIVALLLILVLAALLFILEKNSYINLVGGKESSTQRQTKEEIEQAAKTAAANKQSYLDQTYKDGKPTSQPTNNTPTPAAPSISPATMTLTAKVDGDSVTITTQIQNISSGACRLTASNGASTISPQTAPIIYQPEFSSCAGFTVPKSSLGNGTWSVSVTATPTVGEATTQTTVLEVN